MSGISEKRRYQRCAKTICRAEMSLDGLRWEGTELNDLSAGGLLFKSDHNLELDQQVKFTLFVYNMFSEFTMNLKGHIVRIEPKEDSIYYGIQFDELDKYQRVQLDEIIKSKITLEDSFHTASEEGVYTFILKPRARRSNMASRIRLFR